MRILLTERQRQLLVLTEDFKSQKARFLKQGFTEPDVDRFLKYFRNIKDKKYKQLFDPIGGSDVPPEKRHDIDAYVRFEDLVNVVSYVRGQVDTNDYEQKLTSSGALLYEDDIVEIKQAFSDKMCIQYLAPFKYSWCVSRTQGNAYYSYRTKPDKPTFYFVKLKDRTNRELDKHGYMNINSSNVIDKWHFFVIRVTLNGEYRVTSATNDPGDTKMTWDTILSIEPRLAPYKKYFVSVPQHELDIEQEIRTSQEYCRAPYRDKVKHLNTNVELDNIGFGCSPDDLKAHYINLGRQLSQQQIEMIKDKPALMDRYKVVMNRKFRESLVFQGSFLPITLSLLDDESIKKLKEDLIDKGRRLSDDQFKAAPDEIKLAYMKYGNQLSQGAINSFMHDRQLFSKYQMYLNMALQEKILPLLFKSSQPIHNIILPATYQYMNDKSAYIFIKFLEERKDVALDDHSFRAFPQELKKYYVLSGRELTENMYNELRHPGLEVLYRDKINEKYGPPHIMQTQSYFLTDPFTFTLLTDENYNTLRNTVRNEESRTNLQTLLSVLQRIPHKNPQLTDLYNLIRSEINLKTPPANAPHTKYDRLLIGLMENIDLLSIQQNRENLDAAVMDLSGIAEKMIKFYPFLRVYYNKPTARFTKKPEIVAMNIINGITKQLFTLEYVKYFIDMFSKEDLSLLTDYLRERNQKHMFYSPDQYTSDIAKIQNWYIKNKKKQLGINENKITMQEILNLI